jgi:tRNA threonylcarbamoyladenosine biosynthesis protein TsaB
MKRLLAIDTATSRTVVSVDGAALLATRIEQRHGASLLSLLDELLGPPGAPSVHELSGVVVGTGPGNFTGLRIGMATAKTIAYGLSIPIFGVPTPAALALAAVAQHALDADSAELPGLTAPGRVVAVLQPAGPSDRYLARVRVDLEGRTAELVEPPRVLSPDEPLDDTLADAITVAVDMSDAGRLPARAHERGQHALDGLGAALIALGEARIANGRPDDVAELVPTYVTLPRGVHEVDERVAWSPALA